jgi:hypothetical protein
MKTFTLFLGAFIIFAQGIAMMADVVWVHNANAAGPWDGSDTGAWRGDFLSGWLMSEPSGQRDVEQRGHVGRGRLLFGRLTDRHGQYDGPKLCRAWWRSAPHCRIGADGARE